MSIRAPRPGLLALLCAAALALAACGSGGSSGTSNTNASSSSRKGATVAVIYAGSLAKLMEDEIGPAFQEADGYSFEGFGGGSGEDAKAIREKVRRVDVFVSASAEADKQLEGAAGGDWVSWYSTFATTPLVLGYDPKSKFGEELAKGEPWYEVLSQPGIRVGRTDPKLDPKGKLSAEAVEEAANKLGKPALAKALASFPVFPETALVGRLQAGQLDAGFFYAIEANVAHIPTVSLTPIEKTAAYTVTLVNRAPDQAGAEAFVRYLLQASTATSLTSNGLTPISPATLSGQAGAVPAALRGAVGSASP
ncbi:MAG TPA: substrate-binding domain-containing protein [Solirubrobacteraceae bacterium]|nr:substrate-binding domain-containing protein [Solirubrobacteraceae bacterium]